MKHPRPPGPHRGPTELQPIRADELLPWSALYERLGWGSAAVAEARRRGLRVLRFARWRVRHRRTKLSAFWNPWGTRTVDHYPG